MSSTELINATGGRGGAIHIEEGCTADFTNCTFSRNSAAASDGGAIATEGAVVLKDCVFADNEAFTSDSHCSGDGGAISIMKGTIDLVRCTFINNIAYDRGGALDFSFGSTGLLKGCLFKGNISAAKNDIARDTDSNVTFACADGLIGPSVQMNSTEIAKLPALTCIAPKYSCDVLTGTCKQDQSGSFPSKQACTGGCAAKVIPTPAPSPQPTPGPGPHPKPTPSPPTPARGGKGSGPSTPVFIACGVVAALVAACVLALAVYRGRLAAKKRSDAPRAGYSSVNNELEDPLMDPSVDVSDGLPATTLGVPGLQTPPTSPRRGHGGHGGSGAGQDPEFDMETGHPLNMAAKKVCQQEFSSEEPGSFARTLPYSDLLEATSNFSEFNQIGSGASSAVYKGMVYGVTVAIKSLNENSQEWDDKQFMAEFKLLMTVRHPNLCRLLACSNDGPHRCLLLEYSHGGSLDTRLGVSCPAERRLDCQQRLIAAVGVARGLACLHSLKPPIIHRDVKNQNVLLLSRHVSAVDQIKVADFGTVRRDTKSGSMDTQDLPAASASKALQSAMETHQSTQIVCGTRAYMPPGGCIMICDIIGYSMASAVW
jgi:predicted outer membrane repeat protein